MIYSVIYFNLEGLPASEVTGAISVIVGSQDSLRFTTLREMK